MYSDAEVMLPAAKAGLENRPLRRAVGKGMLRPSEVKSLHTIEACASTVQESVVEFGPALFEGVLLNELRFNGLEYI
jgi:hypothetical protein